MKHLLSLLLAAAMLLGCACAAAEEPALYELASPYGLRIGATFGFDNMRDKAYLEMLKTHFNSVTCNNETKAYSLLDQRACQMAADGMPVMNYTVADAMLGFAQQNGMHVRGHVLVWDAYMPDWFFREGYQYGKPLVNRDTMCARLQSYIDQVVSHFETKFPGLIDCWDVVNEAIGDSASEWDASDARHIRTIRSGVTNYFRDVIGNDYVELSFLYARDAVEKTGADIRLYYNDYNMFYDAKRAAATALAASINSYAVNADGSPRRLIDGIGMQGYIGGYGQQQGCMNPADLTRIRQSIEAYAAMGLDVQITEMAVRNYQNDEASVKQHAAFYADLFEVFKDLNSGEHPMLSSVSIWGAVDCNNLPKDHYAYKLNSPYGGLFDLKYQPKDSFFAVVNALKAR